MNDPSSRRYVGRRVARRSTALALAGCALAACTGPGSDARSTDSAPALRGSSTAPSSGAVGEDPEPSMPATDDADALAGSLEATSSTLRDPAAPADQVRRAAELQQLAVGTLAAASRDYRRTVMSRLRPGTAAMVRRDVTAARLLTGLNTPQRTLPRWQVIEPRPPDQLLRYYRQAQRRTGVPWSYLAAINLVETRMGRIRGDSPAGARGPMQFIPSTWDLYGAGGDVNDPHDAILAAARLLADNGAPGDMAGALWHFNPSRSYVRAVSTYARTMQRTTSAFRGYWYWRVLYRTTRGTFVLPVGYPDVPAVRLPGTR